MLAFVLRWAAAAALELECAAGGTAAAGLTAAAPSLPLPPPAPFRSGCVWAAPVAEWAWALESPCPGAPPGPRPGWRPSRPGPGWWPSLEAPSPSSSRGLPSPSCEAASSLLPMSASWLESLSPSCEPLKAEEVSSGAEVSPPTLDPLLSGAPAPPAAPRAAARWAARAWEWEWWAAAAAAPGPRVGAPPPPPRGAGAPGGLLEPFGYPAISTWLRAEGRKEQTHSIRSSLNCTTPSSSPHTRVMYFVKKQSSILPGRSSRCSWAGRVFTTLSSSSFSFFPELSVTRLNMDKSSNLAVGTCRH
mmetsp:Transcript_7866/g.12419  ORF Transcript_7866/g.12419 Transcript_7866/m.12419 type:complete len:303 (+) Transcript_7866:643-1551(+)